MKLSRIAALAACLVLGAGFVSCTKLQPTEVSNDQRPFTATITVNVSFAESPVGAGVPVILTVTDSEFSKTYKLTRKTAPGGVVVLNQGCGTSGLSVTAECQYVLGEGSVFYGSKSGSATSTNGFQTKIDLKISAPSK